MEVSGNGYTLLVYETPYGKRAELYDSTQEDWKHLKYIKTRRKYIEGADNLTLPQIIKEYNPYYGDNPQIRLY